MNGKLVIGIAAGGALLLLAWILNLGGAPSSAEPALPASAGAGTARGERGAPPLAPLEHEREREGGGESRVAAEGAPADLTILLPGGSGASAQPAPLGPIRGRVLDAEGLPVAGAGIFVGPFGTQLGRGIRPRSSVLSLLGDGGDPSAATDPPQRIGESGDQGRFEVPRLPDGSVLHARGEWHVPVLALTFWSQDPATVEPVLVVARPAAVAGIVVDETNRPIEGAAVAVRVPETFRASLGVILDRAEPLEYHTRSGPDGRFEIVDAPGVPGRRLVAEREGSPAHEETIEAGPETELRIVFQVAAEPESVARGVVVDVDGRPVSDATVRLGGRQARTGSDGKFLLDATGVQPETEIVASKAGFTPGRLPFDPQAEKVTVRLGPPTLRLAGRVVDDAGRPMRSVEVRALGLTRVGGNALEDMATWEGTGPFTVTDSDSEGKFEIGGLQPRAYVVGLIDRASMRIMRTAPIQAGRTDLEIRFQGDAGTVRIAGRVVDRGGAPVPRAEVRLVREIVREEGGPREGIDLLQTADEEGLFDFQEVAADVSAAHAGFPGEMAFEHPFQPGQDLAHLVLVAHRRAHFQVDLAGSELQADSFAVLDAAGRTMPIVIYEGNLAKSSMRWPLQEQRSDALTVLDAAETVVLYRKRDEVGRLPIRLVPGELTVVRP